MTQSTVDASVSAYDVIGGRVAVCRLVDRFYDLLDSEPDYAGLRALHATDLAAMRGSLAGYLTAWLGGPADWFAEHPKSCIMSAHARFAITMATAEQWIDAMNRAVCDAGVEPKIAGQMMERLRAMAFAMVNKRDPDKM